MEKVLIAELKEAASVFINELNAITYHTPRDLDRLIGHAGLVSCNHSLKVLNALALAKGVLLAKFPEVATCKPTWSLVSEPMPEKYSKPDMMVKYNDVIIKTDSFTVGLDVGEFNGEPLSRMAVVLADVNAIMAALLNAKRELAEAVVNAHSKETARIYGK